MTATGTTPIERASLERDLRHAARRLLARQLLRAMPAVLCGAAATTSAALLLVVLLPRVLVGGALAPVPVVLSLSASLGLLGAGIATLRRVRPVGILEAALALEARLETRDGSLPTALQASQPFDGPLVQAARRELNLALSVAAPPVLPLRWLVAVPVALVAVVGLVALAWQTPAADPALLLGGTEPQPASPGLAAINVSSNRDAADADTKAEAMGLRRAAATLSKAAEALRQTGNDAQASTALDDARHALGDLKPQNRPALELPAQLPPEGMTRARLAEDIQAAAGGLSRRAEGLAAGTTGEGAGTGDAGESAEARFSAFPIPAWQKPEELTAPDLAGQSPARRELVRRAMR